MSRRAYSRAGEPISGWDVLRALLFVAALALFWINGQHWTNYLYLAAGVLCFPAVPLKILYHRLHIREWFIVLLALALILTGVCVSPPWAKQATPETAPESAPEEGDFQLAALPDYSGAPYVTIHQNEPYFEEEELTDLSYETYGALDRLGRCTACSASVGQDLMPTQPRGSISSVKPTGWKTLRFDFVNGKYLYNRCHLIGFQLTGENANPNNLITGTRYLNVDGMLPFENEVADYVRDTGNHVLYRVTPYFEGTDLVAQGVLMEARSVEDEGEGVLFCVFCYNVQPGVVIDYATGDAVIDAHALGYSSRALFIAFDPAAGLCLCFLYDPKGRFAR